jgi:hypothetical protein
MKFKPIQQRILSELQEKRQDNMKPRKGYVNQEDLMQL